LFQIYYSILNISEKICIFKDAKYSGLSGQQSQISRLEDKITLDNPVRFIEAFVEYISREALGFTVQTIKSEGRPSFDTKLFVKIYLYGYLHGIRSSRKLEKECFRNIE